jgi:signal transduction histidine kinase
MSELDHSKAAPWFWWRSRRFQRLVEENERLRACVELSGWVYYSIAADGAMRWGRNAAEALASGEHGLPASLEQWLQRIDPAHRDAMRKRYEALLAGHPRAASEFPVRHAEGSEVICEDIAQPSRAGRAAPWEVAGFIRNTTLLKALQEEVKQARPVVSVGRIASMIAHDLANVLSIIHGQSRLLAASPKQDNPGRLTSAIMAAAERGRQLCQQILFVARPRDGRAGACSGELVDELRTMLVGLAQPGVTIEIYVERADLVVPGNSSRLLQALLNLCINAMEAMKDSGGALSLRCSQTRNDAPFPSALGIVPVGRYLCFEVSDTGPGIPQQLLGRIFEPGYSTKEGDTPRGLGLAIIAAVLTEVGAFIDIDSKPGAGTLFRVYVPTPEPAAAAENVLRSARLGRGESVLILDFSEESLLRLEDMVAALGYEPNAFADCEEALRSLKEHAGYKAALVAGNATLGDGAPFYQAIAQYLPAFKIVLVGKSAQGIPAAAMSALIEPFDHADLGAVLAKVVNS